tara:strand:- start:5573 stop:5998 length:426 start_codon:yes stop_codon:yes gene_type:complete
MDTVARNIIASMGQNIFDVPRVDTQIRTEVSFFKKILQENIYNKEVFHGYINKINEAWGPILKQNFKRLISHYNDKYNMDLLLQLEKKQNEMIKMADEYNAQRLFSDLDDLSVSGTGTIASLTKSFKSSGISKKRPSKRRN